MYPGSGELPEGARQLQQPGVDRGYSHRIDEAAATALQGTAEASPSKPGQTVCLFLSWNVVHAHADLLLSDAPIGLH